MANLVKSSEVMEQVRKSSHGSYGSPHIFYHVRTIDLCSFQLRMCDKLETITFSVKKNVIEDPAFG